MNEERIKKISILAEGYLFWAAEPVSKKTLAQAIESHMKQLGDTEPVETTHVHMALEALQQRLSVADSAIVLLLSDDEAELRLRAELSPFLDAIEKNERGRELGKAGMETLAIILYEQGATRRRIEYIRGVNAQFTLRNLLMRGLISKTEREGERSTVYVPTTETLSFLGITSTDQLPHAAEFKQKLSELQVAEDGRKD